MLLGTEPAAGRISGFTTLTRLHATVDGEPVRALFSGDTVTEATYWARNDTARAVALLLQHMLEIAQDVECRWYWFVISSTYRSYRLLPMIFRESYPSPGCDMPSQVTRALEALTARKFGGGYDPESSVIRFPHATVFRSGSDVGPSGGADPWDYGIDSGQLRALIIYLRITLFYDEVALQKINNLCFMPFSPGCLD